MDEETEQLNKKHITDEITGKPFDFDNFDEEDGDDESLNQQEQTEQEPHPLIGIMDMMIASSVVPLQKHGYPAPNISIWDEWGKPNLSKAFYAYVPMDSAAGSAVNSPAFAGLLGTVALGIAFLPCLLHLVETKRKKKEEEEQKLLEEMEVQQDEDTEFENPIIEAKKTVSTAPISRGDSSKGWERVHEIIASQKA